MADAMKRAPGAWLRRKLMMRSIILLVIVSMGVGLIVGSYVHQWLGPPWFVVVSSMMVAIWLAFMYLGRGRWNPDRLEKGEIAEIRVGEEIESAITSAHCAVAHNVQDIAEVGDIHHIVATPARIWVVETKSSKVPKGVFPEVLRRIATNAEAVRQWVPGTPVQGCLVLATADNIGKVFTFGKERIAGHTLASLRRTLRLEARERLSIDKDIAAKVWELARIEIPSPP